MKKVLLFLAQGFEAYEASVFTDVMGWSRSFGNEPVDLITTGLRLEIRCTWNLIVRPELEFEKINAQDFDALALSGGFEKAGFYEDAYDLLDGVRRKQLADFGAKVLDESIVIDRNIITSTGPSTGLDVAFSLLEMLTDKKNVDVVKQYMRFT